ncbi:MAG: molecular chaperone GrpE [Brevinema sp.]
MNEYYAKKVERQKEEIETIKERTITLKLSDADCERISNLAGKSGLSVGEFLASFIGDLVDGTYSNGSDERDRANQWYERCWFSHRYDGEEDSELLGFMLNWGHDVDDFLTAIDEKDYYAEHPEEYEELKEKNKTWLWFEDDIENVTKPYLEKNPKADIKAEIEKCRKWLADLQKMKEQADE